MRNNFADGKALPFFAMIKKPSARYICFQSKWNLNLFTFTHVSKYLSFTFVPYRTGEVIIPLLRVLSSCNSTMGDKKGKFFFRAKLSLSLTYSHYTGRTILLCGRVLWATVESSGMGSTNNQNVNY
jgi:hypothetical protein